MTDLARRRHPPRPKRPLLLPFPPYASLSVADFVPRKTAEKSDACTYWESQTVLVAGMNFAVCVHTKREKRVRPCRLRLSPLSRQLSLSRESCVRLCSPYRCRLGWPRTPPARTDPPGSARAIPIRSIRRVSPRCSRRAAIHFLSYVLGMLHGRQPNIFMGQAPLLLTRCCALARGLQHIPDSNTPAPPPPSKEKDVVRACNNQRSDHPSIQT